MLKNGSTLTLGDCGTSTRQSTRCCLASAEGPLSRRCTSHHYRATTCSRWHTSGKPGRSQNSCFLDSQHNSRAVVVELALGRSGRHPSGTSTTHCKATTYNRLRTSGKRHRSPHRFCRGWRCTCLNLALAQRPKQQWPRPYHIQYSLRKDSPVLLHPKDLERARISFAMESNVRRSTGSGTMRVWASA